MGVFVLTNDSSRCCAASEALAEGPNVTFGRFPRFVGEALEGETGSTSRSSTSWDGVGYNAM